jgi:GNAT superfamily N-acetyltransferase
MNRIPLTVRTVEQDNFDDLARLFEAPGGPSHCWCLAWRPKPKAALEGTSTQKNAARKSTLQGIVALGQPVGLLAYDGTDPVGWCSVGPREGFRPLGGPDAALSTVWSVVCFYVPRRRRGQGVSRLLLDAAIAAAREAGAKILEAYPVAPDSPSYRFMGFVPFFEKAGFTEVSRAGNRRHVMHLAL